MKVLEIITTVLALASVGIFFTFGLLFLIFCLFIFDDAFYEKVEKHYINTIIYLCLPLYGLSLLCECVLEIIKQRNFILSFVVAGIFFIIPVCFKKRKEKKYEN